MNEDTPKSVRHGVHVQFSVYPFAKKHRWPNKKQKPGTVSDKIERVMSEKKMCITLFISI